MPHINAVAALPVSMLLFALPAQYFISRWNWYCGEKKTESGDSEANAHFYFAGSTQVHSPRPEYVQFRVGQVIRFGYSAIIVGWDVTTDTPEDQLQPKYPLRKQDLKNTPHYRILINKANGFGKSTAYVPEEEITIIMRLEVHHPDMETYFRGYDGSKIHYAAMAEKTPFS